MQCGAIKVKITKEKVGGTIVLSFITLHSTRQVKKKENVFHYYVNQSTNYNLILCGDIFYSLTNKKLF